MRKTPSYSLYKCRAGASVADQINFTRSDKNERLFFSLSYRELVKVREVRHVYLSVYSYHICIFIYIFI